MQILKPLQQETSRLAKTLLNQNPELMRKYVDTSIGAISYVLDALNVFMRHLITIQNLDPNSVPGAKAALELEKAYKTLLDKVHEKEYEDNYDISWALKRFKETSNSLKELQLTKEKFMDITNLTRVDCGVEMEPVATLQADGDEFTRTVDPVAPDSDKRETYLLDKQEEETLVGKGDQLRKLIDAKRENALQRIKEKLLTPSGNSDPLAELKKALVEVIKVATDVEEREEKKEQAASEEKKLEVVKKKLNKAHRVVSHRVVSHKKKE